MSSGKKKQFGKIKPQPAPGDSTGGDLAGLERGHPARLIQDRINAIGKEIRATIAEVYYVKDTSPPDTSGGQHEGPGLWGQEEIREGGSTGTGNE